MEHVSARNVCNLLVSARTGIYILCGKGPGPFNKICSRKGQALFCKVCIWYLGCIRIQTKIKKTSSQNWAALVWKLSQNLPSQYNTQLRSAIRFYFFSEGAPPGTPLSRPPG